ncbi:MAG: hypothetical protein JM58_02530 [Peptococcaceae bacterium BICA1-8]|nr:MAG: hypothetical protein JM58_02530 [Peptococcaceae bacterium BICA1-8]
MGGRRFGIKVSNSFIVISIVILVLFLIIYMIESNLKPTVTRMAESKVNLMANEIINKTIYEEILKNTKYTDLIEIHKDSDNKITMIQANSIEISRLMTATNLKIKESLNDLREEILVIPLGQALGSYLFAAHGPKIKVRILPVGEIEVKLHQDFHESGINQTRHILYLDVRTSLTVVIPLATEKITVATKTPIAETIIIGPVPSTMVRLDGLDTLLKGTIYGQ